jgi:tyrosinase
MKHRNVDRLWDIWQALNPNSYVIDKVASKQEANFFLAANTPITANTDLKPFYDSSATRFWNSAGVKYTTPFGYAYPETQRWLYNSDGAYQTDIRVQVTKQYGANVIDNFFANIALENAKVSVPMHAADLKKGAIRKISAKETIQHPIVAAQQILAQNLPLNASVKAEWNGGPGPAANGKPAVLKAEPTQDHNATVTAQAPPTPHTKSEPSSTTVPLNIPVHFAHLVKNRTYTEWITNLRTIKHALNQTFRVYVFLGDFISEPTTWATEHNDVGRFTVFGRDAATSCSKCQQDRSDDLIVTGTVPLTSALLQDIVEGRLASLEPSDVEPYLERHLHWRVTMFDGSEVRREDVPGLKVGVVSTQVRIGEDGVPVYSGVYEQYPGVTDGRPAGLRAGDAI